MQNKLWFILVLVGVIIILAVVVVLIALNGDSGSTAVTASESLSTISVSGEYDIKIPANVAYIEIGVETKDKEVKTAQENNANDINNVIESVKELGLTDDDITTSNYSIYPNYDYSNDDDSQTIEYYTVSNIVKLKIVDLEILGQVLDIATEAGANRAYNIYFDADDTDETQNEALKMAIKDALDRADIIAEAADVKVVGIKEIVDESYDSYGYYSSYDNINMSYAKEAGGGTTIMSGDVTISASVHILVEISD